MANTNTAQPLLFLVLLALLLLNPASGFEDGGTSLLGGRGRSDQMDEGSWKWDQGGGEVVEGEDWFLVKKSVPVIETHAGYMRVSPGVGIRSVWPHRSPMHIGFITMEPQSMFIPQYLDSDIIFFIREGEARIGHIYKDELAEREVKTGDIYTIEAGSAFYIVNTAEQQRLQIICSIHNTPDSLGLFQWTGFQSFFVGGGLYPTSILAGFDSYTMAAALNITVEEVEELVSSKLDGSIVYLSNSTGVWPQFLNLEQHQRLSHLKRIVNYREKSNRANNDDDEKEPRSWSWRNLFHSLFIRDENKKKDRDRKKTSKGPDSYNIYDRKPDFKNDYGWSIALDDSDYPPLEHTNTGMFLVYLEPGSMMAPHINPEAVELTMVLKGNGTIQIVFPNGTMAMNAKVGAGDLFRVPRFYPFCQIASRASPFVFFGFTTSSKKNWPVFLAGQNSLLQLMRGPELAASFGWSEERLDNLTDAQKLTTIFPSQFAGEPKEQQGEEQEGGGEINTNINTDMNKNMNMKTKMKTKTKIKIPRIIKNNYFEDEMIMNGF